MFCIFQKEVTYLISELYCVLSSKDVILIACHDCWKTSTSAAFSKWHLKQLQYEKIYLLKLFSLVRVIVVMPFHSRNKYAMYSPRQYTIGKQLIPWFWVISLSGMSCFSLGNIRILLFVFYSLWSETLSKIVIA